VTARYTDDARNNEGRNISGSFRQAAMNYMLELGACLAIFGG
jgi:hypothetical protein